MSAGHRDVGDLRTGSGRIRCSLPSARPLPSSSSSTGLLAKPPPNPPYPYPPTATTLLRRRTCSTPPFCGLGRFASPDASPHRLTPGFPSSSSPPPLTTLAIALLPPQPEPALGRSSLSLHRLYPPPQLSLPLSIFSTCRLSRTESRPVSALLVLPGGDTSADCPSPPPTGPPLPFLACSVQHDRRLQEPQAGPARGGRRRSALGLPDEDLLWHEGFGASLLPLPSGHVRPLARRREPDRLTACPSPSQDTDNSIKAGIGGPTLLEDLHNREKSGSSLPPPPTFDRSVL